MVTFTVVVRNPITRSFVDSLKKRMEDQESWAMGDAVYLGEDTPDTSGLRFFGRVQERTHFAHKKELKIYCELVGSKQQQEEAFAALKAAGWESHNASS